ncbi:MAG TPA: glucose 1-dehydrogenase [Gemmatales bacterium]|nr:glucose 1-dehydrogenase [Gemmatales bacterium]
MQRYFGLEGKVALVTGASRGIGAAIATGLAACGAQVVVSSRKLEGLAEVVTAITAAGGQAHAVTAHVGDAAALDHLVSETVRLTGGVDVLVNNAAANPVFGPLLATDDAVFDKIMAVNVRAPLTLAKLVHPHMQARGGGSIINVSSIGGLRPEPMLGLYSVSKAALISLTKVQAQEWSRDGIRSNVICPGLVRTKFSAALWQDEQLLGRFVQQVPLGRIAEPEEMAGLAIFLASPAASYVTGGVYTADGGYTA